MARKPVTRKKRRVEKEDHERITELLALKVPTKTIAAITGWSHATVTWVQRYNTWEKYQAFLEQYRVEKKQEREAERAAYQVPNQQELVIPEAKQLQKDVEDLLAAFDSRLAHIDESLDVILQTLRDTTTQEYKRGFWK